MYDLPNDILDFFNNVDDDEVLRLYERSNAILSRVGGTSYNVATDENKLGDAYQSRANRAQTANDLNRCRTNLQMALTHYREAARIYRLNNHITKADAALRSVAVAEENIRQIDIARASVAATVSTRN